MVPKLQSVVLGAPSQDDPKFAYDVGSKLVKYHLVDNPPGACGTMYILSWFMIFLLASNNPPVDLCRVADNSSANDVFVWLQW